MFVWRPVSFATQTSHTVFTRWFVAEFPPPTPSEDKTRPLSPGWLPAQTNEDGQWKNLLPRRTMFQVGGSCFFFLSFLFSSYCWLTSKGNKSERVKKLTEHESRKQRLFMFRTRMKTWESLFHRVMPAMHILKLGRRGYFSFSWRSLKAVT